MGQEVRRILEECHERAREILRTERHRLEALAEALLREESLDEAAILRVTGLEPRSAAATADGAAVTPESAVHATSAVPPDAGPG